MLKIRPVFKFNKIESSIFSRIKTFLQNSNTFQMTIKLSYFTAFQCTVHKVAKNHYFNFINFQKNRTYL